jgi:hypothetical protein
VSQIAEDPSEGDERSLVLLDELGRQCPAEGPVSARQCLKA